MGWFGWGQFDSTSVVYAVYGSGEAGVQLNTDDDGHHSCSCGCELSEVTPVPARRHVSRQGAGSKAEVLCVGCEQVMVDPGEYCCFSDTSSLPALELCTLPPLIAVHDQKHPIYRVSTA